MTESTLNKTNTSGHSSISAQLGSGQFLAGKVALITGSTSGIGLAAAHQLAEQGAHIILHGLLSHEEGQKLKEDFESQYKNKMLFNAANIASVTEIDELINTVTSEFGRLDIVVNNAGIQHTDTVKDFPRDKWDSIIAINLSAAFHITQQALPLMHQQNWGRIINIASVHGLVGSANKSAYVAAKHGLIGLTKVTAIEEASNGITVNAICPGWVETPLINHQIDTVAKQRQIEREAAKHELITNKQPLPEMAQPDQIGDLILFLCTDTARSITGASLPIDGAWTSQ